MATTREPRDLGRLSHLFTGRESRYNRMIFLALSRKNQTLYELWNAMKRGDMERDEITLWKVAYSTVRRRIEELRERGLVDEENVRKSRKGTSIPIWALTAKGVLISLLLLDRRENIFNGKFCFENNPFWALGMICVNAGASSEFCKSLFVTPIIGAIEKGRLSVDASYSPLIYESEFACVRDRFLTMDDAEMVDRRLDFEKVKSALKSEKGRELVSSLNSATGVELVREMHKEPRAKESASTEEAPVQEFVRRALYRNREHQEATVLHKEITRLLFSVEGNGRR